MPRAAWIMQFRRPRTEQRGAPQLDLAVLIWFSWVGNSNVRFWRTADIVPTWAEWPLLTQSGLNTAPYPPANWTGLKQVQY